jgi:hypothetical protein
VTKEHEVTACQGVFKRSLSVMETYAINGVLNIGVENSRLRYELRKMKLYQTSMASLSTSVSEYLNAMRVQ